MTNFVDQTIMHGEGRKGDCFRACLATILGMPIAAVPHFALLDFEDGVLVSMEAAIAWVNLKGYEVDTMNDPKDWDGATPLPLCTINGTSPRGIRHSVVGSVETGEMVHDPHPSRAGLAHISSRFYFFPVPKGRP